MCRKFLIILTANGAFTGWLAASQMWVKVRMSNRLAQAQTKSFAIGVMCVDKLGIRGVQTHFSLFNIKPWSSWIQTWTKVNSVIQNYEDNVQVEL